jgi:hypothetical protein
MENCEKPVQNVKKKRSRSDKVGRFKYNQQLLKKTQKDIEEIKLTQRTILSGLKDFFNFKQPVIEKIACVDEVDREILQALFEGGSHGVLPKDLAARLARFKVTRHQISRRILRMNKRLEKELGKHAAEKRGWHWALTSFAAEVWGETP